MATRCFTPVKGYALRATKLDACGRPIEGDDTSIVTEGFISVGFTANINEGEEITSTNAQGRTCAFVPAEPEFTGYTLEIQFCEVNPELFAMLTGQPVVVDSEGNITGFRMSSSVNLAGQGFALELWSLVPGQECDDDSDGSYGYLLLPFVKGGVLGDFSVENAALTFTLSNASTRDGSGWGVGPYNVVMNGGVPSPLLGPIGSTDHLHLEWTGVAPPAADCRSNPSTPAPLTVTAGDPGDFGPVDAWHPADLEHLQELGLTPSPATAWTTGDHVVLRDESEAYWDGSAWVVGMAP